MPSIGRFRETQSRIEVPKGQGEEGRKEYCLMEMEFMLRTMKNFGV